MSTPCNSLNVQLIKISQLSNYSSLKDTDLLMIVENTGGSKYSRSSALSNVRSYMLDNGLTGFPSTSFKTNTDTNNLTNYSSGGFYTYSHNFGSVPSLTRVVLYCNSTDGSYIVGDELEMTSCINNLNRPLASVSTDVNTVSVSFLSFTSAFAYSKLLPVSLYTLSQLRWQIKIYVWK
jgi:hypothetical protein